MNIYKMTLKFKGRLVEKLARYGDLKIIEVRPKNEFQIVNR